MRWLPAAVAIGLCGAAAWALHHELSRHPWSELRAAVRAIPSSQLRNAGLLTLLSYVVLTGYDTLAMKDLGIKLRYRRTALASFIGYVFSHNVGLSVLGGGAARYRLYGAYGLSAVDIFKVVAFCATTFWIGMLFLTGIVLLVDPSLVAARLHLPDPAVRIIGFLLVGAVAGYVVWCRLRRTPLQFRGFSFTLPTMPIAMVQVGLSAVDWLVAASVLHAVLPADLDLPYHRFLAIYLASIVLAAASHVPGGIGVFESLVLSMLHEYPNRAALIGSLIAYRVIYYLLPLGVGVISFAVHELAVRLVTLRRLTILARKWGPAIMPRVLAVATFVGGSVLLLSGATPPEHSRIQHLASHLPLSIVEGSHFLASVVGVLLLLLAHGLQQRVDFAWFASVLLLVAGALLSLLKGLDWEEALVLGVILVALIPCRREFTRQASLLGDRFTGGWIAALAVVLLTSTWLVLFSSEHFEVSQEAWWHYSFRGDAPRSLRATVGAAVVLMAVGVTRLLRPTAPKPALPDAVTLARALPIIRESPDTLAWLALLGDKTLLFNSSGNAPGNAFLMYAVEGRSWVALGDPVGSEREKAALVWEFREISYRGGGSAVFYQVLGDRLPLYLDLGFTLLELGEEARVPLAGFGLDGDARKSLRDAVKQVEQAGCTFEVVPPEAVSHLVPDLARVSFDWLEMKKTREKGFSVGSFQPDYLRHFPLALVKRGERIVAFANVCLGGNGAGAPDAGGGRGALELSVDLMRHDHEAPSGVMDFVFVKLMQWGAAQGFAWFNLGMAPLPDLDPRPLAPLWNKIGSALFKHGEPFHNFQGLRQHKEQFGPTWRPRYLATPGGLALPGVLANVATLIGGTERSFLRSIAPM